MGPWALGVPIVLVSALGLLLNAYVLLVVLGLGKQMQQQQTANTWLLIHLGAVETAVCLVLLIFATGTWPAAGTWCVLHGFLLALLHPVALWTVTGLNCDRYYAIAAPLHYTHLVSPRRVALGLAISWTGALLLCLPPFSGLVPPYRYVPGLGCCAPDFGNGNWGSAGSLYGAVYVILGIALPALLVTMCNLKVLGIARYHRHRIASAIYEVTLSAQVTITHQRNPFFVPAVTAPAAGGPPRFHSAASTVMQLVGSLYLLYFPYCGLILWEACGGSAAYGTVGGSSGLLGSGSALHQQSGLSRVPQPKFASLASLLLACSPPINGLLYGLKSRTLRRSVQNYWRKKATKSELQQEIQARTPSAAGSRRPSGSGPSTSFFQFPPLQRRLSEALIALGSCRAAASFGSGTIAGVFHRSRLQPAASCNTLRVPNAELGESGHLVRSSASAASLMGAHYRNEFTAAEAAGNGHAMAGETPKRSPRILITRAYSEESQEGGGGGAISPLLKRNFNAPVSVPPCEKRRWRHRSNECDSNAISCDASSVWTTGVQATKPPLRSNNLKGSPACGNEIWGVRRFMRVKTLEEGAAVFSAALLCNNNNNHNNNNNNNNNNNRASNRETIDVTTDINASNLLTKPLGNEQQQQQRRTDGTEDLSASDREDEDEDSVVRERGEEDEEQRKLELSRASPTGSTSSYSACADETIHSVFDNNSRASSEGGLIMHPIGETIEIDEDAASAQEDKQESQEEEDEEEEAEEEVRPGGKRSRRKSRTVRELEKATTVVQDQLRPLLASSSS